MALFGHGPMSDLSPLSGEERKSNFGAVRSVDDPKPTWAGRNSQCSRPLLTQCDVVSLGSSTGETAASRRPPYDRLNLREIACNGSIASRQHDSWHPLLTRSSGR